MPEPEEPIVVIDSQFIRPHHDMVAVPAEYLQALEDSDRTRTPFPPQTRRGRVIEALVLGAVVLAVIALIVLGALSLVSGCPL